MRVLVTGGNGRVGTAIIDHLRDRPEYDFRSLDVKEHLDGDRDTFIGSVEEYEDIRPVFEDVDAVVHLAVHPQELTDENWERIWNVNIAGTRNVLRAASEAEVGTVVFSSSNHVHGMYEREFAPDIYELDCDICLDRDDAVRPDSLYGVSKLFGENCGRFFVENRTYPQQFYALRICSLREERYDHPYGDAEQGVEAGQWERGSNEYEQAVKRLKAMWFSRRDCANMVDRMLQDDGVSFDVFSGVSDNDRSWFDISHAVDVLEYDPQDNAETWDEPP